MKKHILNSFSAMATAAARRSVEREREVLTMIQHPNMIKLLGDCLSEEGEQCLVYEYGTHGSLAENLRDGAKAASLGWKARVRRYDATQRAFKIIINSFYGVQGQQQPPKYKEQEGE